MILPGTASLILSVAQQLIKLGGRLDRLMAQRAAVESDLVLSMPTLRLGNAQAQFALVTKALADTAGQQPDPFGPDRAALLKQLAQPDPGFDALFAKYFPDQLMGLGVSPDTEQLAALQKAFPGLDWKKPAIRIAAFAIAAGDNPQQISYTARIALAVTDTLLEFGADNTALFVRDEKLRGIIESVLQRFAQPDWAGYEQWNPLLQTALKTTLNAALDVGEQLPAKNPWLDGVLDALVAARAAVPEKDRDNYLLSLIQGEGVPLLLSQGLLVASDRLGQNQAAPFKLVAADVLAAAAPFIQNRANPDLGRFFRDHWGDLLRAGLTSLDKHGDSLLTPDQPLLNDVLKALVQQLSTTPDAGFLTSETLHQLADTAIDIVAANPGEIPGIENKPWLREFLATAAQTAKQLTAKKLFTKEAAEALVLDAIGVLAQHPDLIVKQQGLPLTLATDVLTAVARLKRLDARTLVEAALRATLNAIANDASLAAGKFGSAITTVASQLATLVGNGKITGTQAADIATAAIGATARNPQLFAGLQKDIAGLVITTVQEIVPNKPDAPWASRLLVPIISEVLLAVARSGGPAATSQPIAKLKTLLSDVLAGGLKLASDELGRSIDLDGIPPVLGGLIARALRGDLKNFTPTSSDFAIAFATLAVALPRS